MNESRKHGIAGLIVASFAIVATAIIANIAVGRSGRPLQNKTATYTPIVLADTLRAWVMTPSPPEEERVPAHASFPYVNFPDSCELVKDKTVIVIPGYPAGDKNLVRYAASMRTKAYECEKEGYFLVDHEMLLAMRAGEEGWKAYLEAKHRLVESVINTNNRS
jgi:hypothetical protein